MFRRREPGVELFLAHPGGPFWMNKDDGAWTLPKGVIEEGEEPLAAAVREFAEETGIKPGGPYLPLGSVIQKAGKTVHGWAFAGDADPAEVRSNRVPMRVGGGWRNLPEIDRCGWFTPEEARKKLNPAQAAFVDRLLEALQHPAAGATP